ncbi:Hypothetical predicted protein [Pelobates cultripes]|uniref:Uncharacterized protein n=1 Tax=Pelobates cultripes TaxID=61616 RepID=A0AAD1TL12_PELCU|nr:Hypothetical predicted protein [Pelobates cultripes]
MASQAASQRNKPHAFAACWHPDWLTPDSRQALTQEPEMVKKTQKSQVHKPQDIGTLLQRTPKHENEACDPQEKGGVSEDAQGSKPQIPQPA